MATQLHDGAEHDDPDESPDLDDDFDELADGAEREGPLSRRGFGILLVVCAALGLFAAGMLTIEKFALLADPDHRLTCDLNGAVNCRDVMSSDQASAFGFPNPILGLVAWGVVICVGMGLLAGARYRQWFWTGLQVGATLGFVFVHWLMFHTVFVIGALCPYCMLTWAVTAPVFGFTTARNLMVRAAARGREPGFVARNPLPLLIVWYAAVATLVVVFLAVLSQ